MYFATACSMPMELLFQALCKFREALMPQFIASKCCHRWNKTCLCFMNEKTRSERNRRVLVVFSHLLVTQKLETLWFRVFTHRKSKQCGRQAVSSTNNCSLPIIHGCWILYSPEAVTYECKRGKPCRAFKAKSKMTLHPSGMTQEEQPTQQGVGGGRVTHRSSPRPKCPWHCRTSPGG